MLLITLKKFLKISAFMNAQTMEVILDPSKLANIGGKNAAKIFDSSFCSGHGYIYLAPTCKASTEWYCALFRDHSIEGNEYWAWRVAADEPETLYDILVFIANVSWATWKSTRVANWVIIALNKWIPVDTDVALHKYAKRERETFVRESG